jgi:DNA-binding transcriptional regulator YiaG
MLEAASKTILKTTDPTVANRSNVRDMDNLEIVGLAQGTDLSQVDTFPRNLALFERSVAKWEEHAQQMGGATEALFGDNPSAGTPFKLQESVVRQGMGLHEYRKGIYAKHIEEIYKDWIIPHIEKKICEGTTFLSELSLDELQYVADCVIRNAVNEYLTDKLLTGNYDPATLETEKEIFKQRVADDFKRKGSKHFVEILKGEFKDAGLSVKVSVAGKSKDLSGKTDALVNVFRQIIANPGVLQIPAMARIFNDILESSGLEPADFSGVTQAQLQPAQGPTA